jgi:Tfp pilus assembly protein PilN
MRAVNLIPADQRTGASVGAGRSQGGAYAVLGVVAGLALLALLYGIAAHQVSSRKGKLQTLEAQVQQAQASSTQLAPYTSFQTLREERTKAVNQLVNSRFDWAHAFHEFGRVLPANVSLSSISGAIAAATGAAGASTANSSSGPSSSGGVQTATPSSSSGTVASSTPPGSVPTFTVTGCAINQSTVALTLERLRLMDGVSAVSLQSSTKSGGGGGGSGAGGSCPARYPAFTTQVKFEALPTATTVVGAAKTAKPSGGA